MQNNHKDFEDLLESDDELPIEYNEEPEIPAYQNDTRFDDINFCWLTNTNFNTSNKTSKSKSETSSKSKFSLYALLNEETVKQKTCKLKYGEKSLINKGVLSLQDLYCLKCIEPFTNDAIFLWFINFLIYKDLQSDYMFLKSCLVSDVLNTTYYRSSKSEIDTKRHNFEIIMKT